MSNSDKIPILALPSKTPPVRKKAVRHNVEFTYWRLHGRSNNACAIALGHSNRAVAKWRADEMWDSWADSEDADMVADITKCEEVARSFTMQSVQLGLQQLLDMQRILSSELAVQFINPQTVAAVTAYMKACVGTADTLFNWSKLKIDLKADISVTDTSAIEARLKTKVIELLADKTV
jgi:hypothetical protein